MSISGLVSMANCISIAIMTKYPSGGGLALALAATVAACMLGGALNGFCVARLRLPAIIVTIATCSVFNGIALLAMDIPVGSVNYAFADFINYKIGGFPISFSDSDHGDPHHYFYKYDIYGKGDTGCWR